MLIELLKIRGCPGADVAYDRLCEVLHGLGVEETIRTIEIATEEQAQQLRFIGSPTLRVDGRDVEGSPDPTAQYALTCRLYRSGGSVQNAPSSAAIRRAVMRERIFASSLGKRHKRSATP
jgi:hypothetical protein